MKYWSIGVLLLLLSCQQTKAPPDATTSPDDDVVGYANPELIVDTEWLAQSRAGEVAIVDARAADDYTAGHIPGAVSIPRNATFEPDAELRVVGSPEQIAELFGRQGIDENIHVVVYDDGLSTAAARIFWTLEYYGHPRVSVLNGGLTKWEAEGRGISVEMPEPTPTVFDARAREDSLTTKAEIEGDLDNGEIVLLDSRAPEEYSGDELHSERGGHIPGAVNIEWTRNFDDSAPVLKSARELEAMYAQQGVTRDKRVHAY